MRTLRRIAGIAAIVFGVIALLPWIIALLIFPLFDIHHASAVGVIGSADSPTYVILSSAITHGILRYGATPAAMISLIVWLVLRAKTKS